MSVYESVWVGTSMCRVCKGTWVCVCVWVRVAVWLCLGLVRVRNGYIAMYMGVVGVCRCVEMLRSV